MKLLRYRMARWLFDVAARLYPLSCKKVAEAHHVGDKWLFWSLEREAVQP